MIMENIINTLKERWKYLLVAYLFGCAIPLVQHGVPHWYYLIPIKASAIFIGWVLGNALSTISSKRPPIYKIVCGGVLYVISGGVLYITFVVFLRIVCGILGIKDIQPFM